MQTINVLSIGNSFSQDAQTYLHDLARSEGVALETVNLYIGGCSLEQHYENIRMNSRAYTPEVNGHHAQGFWVSIDEALEARAWDIVTVQQASHFSYRQETYHPYLEELARHIREKCPGAKIFLHETWGYESGSDRIRSHGFETYGEMFRVVRGCYEKAAASIDADGILPCGRALGYALSHGAKTVHRDTFHASYGLGRFLLALVWYGCICRRDISHVRYQDFSEPVTEEEYRIALEATRYAIDSLGE